MSVCYYQMSVNNISEEKFRYIDVKLITFYINIDKLLNIIKGILSDFCKTNVIGYNKETNKYWCKTYDKKYCALHVELEIFKKCNSTSYVKFIPLIGTDYLIKNFVSNFTEAIQLYTTSPFIKSCLEGNSRL
jgi:hypothetical protein